MSALVITCPIRSPNAADHLLTGRDHALLVSVAGPEMAAFCLTESGFTVDFWGLVL